MSLELKILKLILLLTGTVLSIAFLAVLLPVSWMEWANDRLKLDTFPDSALTIYLARSTSLLYGIHGVMMLYTAMTIDRHWRYVPLFGWLHMVIGVALIVIDITSPMPLYWTLIEGGPVAGMGALILWLYRRADLESLEGAAPGAAAG